MAETELDRFFRENRLREAQSVNPSVFADPRYASMIYNSSVPLNQLEKNIQQSQGYMLEPAYNPTMRDTSQKYVQSALDYLKSKGIVGKDVQEGKKTLKDVTESFTGTEDSIGLVDATPIGSLFAAQEGQRAIEKAEPDAFKRSMALLSFMRKPFQTYLDRPDIASPAFDIGSSAVEGLGFAYLARPLKKQFKNFAKSLADKIKGEDEVSAPTIGALPKAEPKMLASTRRMPPGGGNVMTDPKVVDEYGFYSEAERQTKMLNQNKGTGAQFQGMLLNKGVKLDEIKALGLDELFKNDKVTKQDILDTIDMNKIKFTETVGKYNKAGVSEDEFTTATKMDGTDFTSADEVEFAIKSGNYTRPKVNYTGSYLGNDVNLVGEVNTHVPTGHKIVMVEKSTDSSVNALGINDISMPEFYLTYLPGSDVSDWRNSIEAQKYVERINRAIDQRAGGFGQTKKAEIKNLTEEDLDKIIDQEAPFTFNEAMVQMQSTIDNRSNIDTREFTKFEEYTQPGGSNYREYRLSLPPINKETGRVDDNIFMYDDDVDFKYDVHFSEYNPIFHIRTKDRVTPDGKKVLYVEEFQSDFGQQGRERGFKLKGEDLKKAQDKFDKAKEKLIALKDIEVKLTPREVENYFALKNPETVPIDPLNPDNDYFKVLANLGKDEPLSSVFPGKSKAEIIDFYNPPPEYATATIEDIAKLRRYQSYKVAHNTGDISDEFFNQLDLNQLSRNQDELKEEIIRMFLRGRLDKFSQLSFKNATTGAEIENANKIIDDFYKAERQAKGENAEIPVAPFVTDTEKWTKLGIKRLIQMAEKGGYDHIAFSPGDIQVSRWGEEGLKEFYDKIIKNVAEDYTKKMGDKVKGIKATDYIDLDIPDDRSLILNASNKGYFVSYARTDKPIDNKYFKTQKEANAYADEIEARKNLQKTFAINLTPKMKQTVKEGIPMFSFIGGGLGVGATMNNENYGALSNMPSTQANAT